MNRNGGRNLIYHFDLWTTKANFAVECIHRRTPKRDVMLGKDGIEGFTAKRHRIVHLYSLKTVVSCYR